MIARLNLIFPEVKIKDISDKKIMKVMKMLRTKKDSENKILISTNEKLKQMYINDNYLFQD